MPLKLVPTGIEQLLERFRKDGSNMEEFVCFLITKSIICLCIFVFFFYRLNVDVNSHQNWKECLGIWASQTQLWMSSGNIYRPLGWDSSLISTYIKFFYIQSFVIGIFIHLDNWIAGVISLNVIRDSICIVCECFKNYFPHITYFSNFSNLKIYSLILKQLSLSSLLEGMHWIFNKYYYYL